jgi:DNA-binding NarL/FixJ family response regulator
MERLYVLALAEGRRVLRGFRVIDEARREDLVVDLLVERLAALLRAQRPRAFFRAMVYNAARSWLRRGDAVVLEEGDPQDGERAPWGVDDDAAARIDGRRALLRMTLREQRILVLVGLGDDREAIAKEFRTSRANVDQIVSRVRRRAGGGASRRQAA